MAKETINDSSKLGLLPLVGLVIGSIVGGGVFNLMRDVASAASPIAVMIGWLITGLGMIMLALSFQNLARKKPKLNAGIYSYAKAGFGDYMGFNAAWGYWLSAFIGNVAYGTLMFSALYYFLPQVFDAEGQKLPAIIGASVFLWFIHFLIVRGIKSASYINGVVTIAKMIPLAIFILAAFFAFKLNIFSMDLWGTAGANATPLFDQVRNMMTVTIWVFIGIEGAVVLSGRARKSSDVSKATMIGLFTVMALYLLISILSLGVMARPELAELHKPAMAALLQSIVGPWGAGLINLGVIVSVAGAWLAWTLLTAEIPYEAAKNKVFPKFFARESAKGVPITSLLITNGIIQLFFISFLIPNFSAYNVMFSLASTAIMVPYAFVAMYQLKVSLAEKAGTRGRMMNIIIGLLGTIYAAWLIYAVGMGYLLIVSVLYAVGIIFYLLARAQYKQKAFNTYEMLALVVIVLVTVYAVWQITTTGTPANEILFPPAS